MQSDAGEGVWRVSGHPFIGRAVRRGIRCPPYYYNSTCLLVQKHLLSSTKVQILTQRRGVRDLHSIHAFANGIAGFVDGTIRAWLPPEVLGLLALLVQKYKY